RPDTYPDSEAEAVLKVRLRRAATRYIGMVHLELPTVPDKRSLMASTVNSVEQFDDMDDDLIAAGVLSHRPRLAYNGPVSLSTGIVHRRDADMAIADTPRVSFERVYSGGQRKMIWPLPFGIGANHSFGSFLVGDAPTFSHIDLILEDGSKVHYR